MSDKVFHEQYKKLIKIFRNKYIKQKIVFHEQYNNWKT